MLTVKGLSFVALMVLIALTALFLRIGIDRIIKVTIVQNDSAAQANLKLISAALDKYASDHEGNFPASITFLTHNNPAYLDKDYIAKSPVRGYEYSCARLEASGYSCSAVPLNCNLTGKAIYTVTTGGLIVSEECKDKE